MAPWLNYLFHTTQEPNSQPQIVPAPFWGSSQSGRRFIAEPHILRTFHPH